MNATRFAGEFKRSPLLQRGLFTYLNALMAQITQTAKPATGFTASKGGSPLAADDQRPCPFRQVRTDAGLPVAHARGAARRRNRGGVGLQNQKLIEYARAASRF